jgi:hypothetical protein
MFTKARFLKKMLWERKKGYIFAVYKFKNNIMITYKKEECLSNFNFWSGATQLAENLTNSELEKISEALEWQYSLEGTVPTDTRINELFWFESEFICELIGLSLSEVMKR